MLHAFPYRLFIGLLLGFALPEALFAQSVPITFEHIGTRDGLPSNKITAIHQDSAGFIWIGTQDGLHRFDGIEFTAVQANAALGSHSIGWVNNIFQDRHQQIWASTENNGHFRVRPDRQEIKSFDQAYVPGSEIDINRANQGLQSMSGTVYLGTRAGLYAVSEEDSLIRQWPTLSPEHEEYMPIVYALAEDRKGRIWIGGRNGLHFHLPQNEQAPPEVQIAKINHKVRLLYFESERNQMWIGTDYGKIYRYEPDTDVLEEISTGGRHEMGKGNFPTAFCRDSRGRLWMGTSKSGLHRFHPKRNSFEKYSPSPYLAESRIDPHITAIHSDHQGNLWIGTGKGLYKFHPGHQPFRNTPLVTTDGEMLAEGDVQSIFLSREGVLWVGSFGKGLFFLGPDRLLHPVSLPIPPRWYPVTFAEEAGGKLWIGSAVGLHTYDPATGDFAEIEAFRPYFFKEVFDLQFAPDGSLWIGLPSSELISLDPHTQQIETHPLAFSSEFRGGCRFNSLQLADDSTLWVGTAECGIWTFDLRERRFLQEHISGRTSSGELEFPSIEYISLGVDECYFSIASRGFSTISGKGRARRNITIAQGLPSNRISGFVPHGEKVWVFTGNGLVAYEKESQKIQAFGHREGLPESEFSHPPVQDPETGLITALTDNYLIQFHPDSLLGLLPPPPVRLLAFERFGQSFSLDSLRNAAYHVTIPYHRNSFSLQFASLNYLHNSGTRYAYRLQGRHQDWISNGPSRKLRFADLPGGDYQLQVRAQGKGGPWNEAQTLLFIHVTTPFWKTWWFIGLCAALVLGIAFAIYRMRVERLLAIVRIRSKISRNLHDEIGSSLTSISILSQVLLVKHGDADPSSRELLQKIHNHVSRTMSSMDDIIWTINPVNDKAERLFVRFRQIAAELLEPQGIEFQLDFSLELKDHHFNVDQRWHLTMIFKEALNNASKYADCKSFRASIFKQDRKIRMSLSDDGKGFDLETPNQRNGLKNMRERAREMKGELEIRSSPGEGTRIELSIPK